MLTTNDAEERSRASQEAEWNAEAEQPAMASDKLPLIREWLESMEQDLTDEVLSYQDISDIDNVYDTIK